MPLMYMQANNREHLAQQYVHGSVESGSIW